MTFKIKENITAAGFLLVTILILLYQASLPIWRGHLQVDVVTFFNRYLFFVQNGSYKGIEINEYQPGALLFFLIPGLFSKVIFYRLLRPYYEALIFLLMIIFSGPILLFRFELLVSIFVLVSFYCWQQEKKHLSLFLLGIAVSVKVYPVVFLPYYVFLFFRNKRKRKDFVQFMLSFLLGLMTPIALTMFMGLSIQQILKSLAFHSFKPIGIEGFPGMVLTFFSKIQNGIYPQYIGGYGVNGLLPKSNLFNLNFYNQLWIVPTSLFYLFLFTREKKAVFRYEIAFLIVTLFLIFFKGLNPQYIFWFLPLVPMIKLEKNINFFFTVIFFIMIIPLLTQYVYPIAYTEFLQGFYSTGRSTEIFFLNSLKNILVVLLWVNVFIWTFWRKNEN